MASRRSILEEHRSPREQWFHAVDLVLQMLRMIRSFAMSGRRFMAAVKAAATQARALRDGSFNIAVSNASPANANEASKSMNLIAGAKKILSRTDSGTRDDHQIDLLLKAFPLLIEIENEKTARALCQAMRIRSAPSQQVMIKQGHLGKEMIGILAGNVRIIVTPDDDSIFQEDDENENENSSSNEDWKTVPNGTLISILKPGDLFLRTSRSVHMFESFALAATGRDLVDDEIVHMAFVDADTYSTILMNSRIARSSALSETALQRRRSNLRNATSNQKKGSKSKLKGLLNRASKKISLKKRQATGNTNFSDAIELKLSEKDRVRICMARPPDRRTVEELEFIISYLERCGFWQKIQGVKEKDDAKKIKTKTSEEGEGGGDTSGSGITPRLQREIVKNLRQLMYGKKEVVFEEKSKGNYFYYVLTGSVIVRKREGTRARTLCTLQTGACFGELALSKHGTGLRSATIVTREMCEFLVLPKEMYTKSVESFQEKHLTHRLNILKSSSIFIDRTWSNREMKSIAYPLEELDFRTDQMICTQGRFATHVFFVQRGECSAFKTLEHDGKKLTMSLGRLSIGDCFGMQACGGTTYVQNTKYSISVVATTPCSVFTLTRYDVFNRILPPLKEELQERASKHPWIQNNNLCRRLVNRNRFQDFLKNKKETLMPKKYQERKLKSKIDMERKKNLKKRKTRERIRSASESSLMFPNIQSRIEQHPPPSRQCSRISIKIAACTAAKLEKTSPKMRKPKRRVSPVGSPKREEDKIIDWSNTDGTIFNGLLPIEKHLGFSEDVMNAKIEKWIVGESSF